MKEENEELRKRKEAKIQKQKEAAEALQKEENEKKDSKFQEFHIEPDNQVTIIRQPRVESFP